MATAQKKGLVNIVVITDELGEAIDERLTDDTGTGAATGVQSMAKLLSGIAGGVRAGKVYVSVQEVTPGTSAPGADLSTLQVTINHSDLSNNDYIDIGPVRLTWKPSPANENEIDIKTSNSTSATELARGINEHSLLSGLVTAVATNNKVDITSRVPGPLGRFRVATNDVSAMGFASSDETTAEAAGLFSQPDSDSFAAIDGGNYEYKVSMG